MENGLFSTDGFAEWSKGYVMFLHVTTHIEGREHDGLLKEKGFTGFPSLAFMDDAGNVIARHSGARTLAPLKKTADAGEAYRMMRKKAEGGDSVAAQHVFVEDLGLGRYDFTRGSLVLATMRSSMPAKLREKAERRLATVQYQELTARLRAKVRELPRGEYSKRYTKLNLEFYRAGLIPDGYRAASVLLTVMNHARTKGDAELFGKALGDFKTRFGKEARYGRIIERYEGQLEEMRGGK